MIPEKSSLSEYAEKDLSLQYQWYLKEADFEVAERFLEVVFVSLSKLEKMPGAGRLRRFPRAELKGIHSFSVRDPFQKHLIFYREEKGWIEVVRILHGSRDLPRRLVDVPSAND